MYRKVTLHRFLKNHSLFLFSTTPMNFLLFWIRIVCCFSTSILTPSFWKYLWKPLKIHSFSHHKLPVFPYFWTIEQINTVIFFFGLFVFFRATPATYGGSQGRGWIRAIATGLHQSHSNTGSEPRLQPTPQLTATPDLWPTERGQGSNPHPDGW